MAKRRSTRNNPDSAGPPVRVRMYRQGLGDCFLLSFGSGEAARHMLIDCGTLGTTSNPDNTLKRVVADIRATTGDHLSILVGTHEHRDHLSGFSSQSASFDEMTIDRVWLAWTEDADDDLARRMARYKRDLGLAVQAGIAAIRSGAGGSAGLRKAAEAAADVLGFSTDSAEIGVEGGGLAAGKFAPTIDAAMDYVRDLGGSQTVYHRPGGRPIELADIPGFRFYVLGPPRNEDRLGEMGDHGSSELYGLRAAAMSLAGLAAEGGTVDQDAIDLEMPFDPKYRVQRRDQIKEMYPGYRTGGDWRALGDDWLRSTADLALQLDGMTNNTSLALAIERIADGRVLLFPADAQQGNWLSWHEAGMKWEVDDGAGRRRSVSAADLLGRTVFYKAGHHGSHNATARGKGLEMMKRKEELVAFIPVDRKVALGKSPKGSWRMPARPLYRRLLERCRGRVVRSDIGWADDAAKAKDKSTEKELRGIATPAEWERWRAEQAVTARVRVGDPLYIDYVLE